MHRCECTISYFDVLHHYLTSGRFSIGAMAWCLGNGLDYTKGVLVSIFQLKMGKYTKTPPTPHPPKKEKNKQKQKQKTRVSVVSLIKTNFLKTTNEIVL